MASVLLLANLGRRGPIVGDVAATVLTAFSGGVPWAEKSAG